MNDNATARKTEVTRIALPVGATQLVAGVNALRRYINPPRNSADAGRVKYELLMPLPPVDLASSQADLDQAIRTLFGPEFGLPQLVERAVRGLSTDADNSAKMAMLVVAEGPEGGPFTHEAHYSEAKHAAMQAAMEAYRPGEPRQSTAGTKTAEKVSKAKTEAVADTIARLKAAGLLPEDFTPDMV